MNSSLLGRAIAVGVFVFVSGCTTVGDSSGDNSSSSSSGGAGPGGWSSSSGSGSNGSGGSGGGVAAPGALPASTFLYVSRVGPDRDVLLAYDWVSGEARTITDQRGDGSNGWPIDGYSLSPDRTRIALASLYDPTQADVATGLAANRIWTLAADGSDFRRLTPVWKNTGGGRTGFSIEVRDPVFARTGADVLFSYGEYWYEGTWLEGASSIWSVDAEGGALPDLFEAPSPCSLTDASVDPSTGRVAIIHSVCVPGQGQQDGIYLYDESGGGTPELLIGRDSGLDVALEAPRWVADGSGFVFVAVAEVPDGNTTRSVRGLFVFDMEKREATPVVLPEGPDARVVDATIAPDASAIVYCLEEGDARNLHLIDLSGAQATDAALTNDGTSCHPVW